MKTLNMTKLTERYELRKRLVAAGFSPNCLFCERPLPFHDLDCIECDSIIAYLKKSS